EVTIVKDFVDKHYRTIPDAAHTAMIGSSFGATISTYLGAAYKDQIGRLGIFSLTNWAVAQDFDRYIQRITLPKDQRIYIECGYSGQNLAQRDRKSTRLNSSHVSISYAVFCLKKKKQIKKI